MSLIESSRLSVYPAEAERLLDGVVIRDSDLARILRRKHEPYFALRLEMFFEPRPPLFPRPEAEYYFVIHDLPHPFRKTQKALPVLESAAV